MSVPSVCIFRCEEGRRSIDGFRRPDTGLIVSVTVDVRRVVLVFRLYRDLRENSAVRPFEFHVPIGENIAVCIVGQVRAVNRGQFILPGRVAVVEGRGLTWGVLITIDFGFGGNIASLVVAVSFRKAVGRVHRLRQLPILVVAIRLLSRAIASACDPVLGVISIDDVECCVIAQRDGLLCDILFRVVAVSCRENGSIIVVDRLCGYVIAVVVREAIGG